jgi:hypothetical protein
MIGILPTQIVPMRQTQALKYLADEPMSDARVSDGRRELYACTLESRGNSPYRYARADSRRAWFEFVLRN